MSAELESLGRRAVACKRWRWMPGMLCYWKERGGASGQQVRPTSARVAELPMGPLPLAFCIGDPSAVYSNALPDLSDPATLGCLLALVREAWVDLHMVAHCDDRYGKTVWWLSRWGDLPRSCECSTEASALVAALEAAP